MGKGKGSVTTVLRRMGEKDVNNTVNNTMKSILYNRENTAVTKVKVPMNFGVENLQCPVHNNIKLMVSNDEEVKANSLILSFNSSVFHHRFFQQHCTIVDLTNFTKKDATYFIKALYSGTIILNQTVFRKINELAHKFEIDWLIARCDTFFQSKVQFVHPFKDDYEALEFALGEAWYAKKTRKSEKHMRIILENTVNMEAYRKQVFIKKYATNYLYLTVEQLNLMIELAGNNEGILLKIVQENLVKQQYDLDDNSIHILKHINLENCIECDTDNFNEMFVNTLNNVSDSKKVDEIRRLGSDATENVLKRKPHLQSKVKAIYVSCPSTENVTYASIVGSSNLAAAGYTYASLNQQIGEHTPRSLICNENLLEINNDPTCLPNLFHLLTSLELKAVLVPGSFYDKGILLNDILDAASKSVHFKNLYMVLEILLDGVGWLKHVIVSTNEVTKSDLQAQVNRLIDIRSSRGWSRVSSTFFWNRHYFNDIQEIDGKVTNEIVKKSPLVSFLYLIKNCKDIVSDEDSAEIVCHRGNLQVILSSRRYLYPRTIRMGEFLFENEESDATRVYKFYWKHPKIVSCPYPEQCGFVINVTPMKKGDPNNFNVGLGTEVDDYPDDIHFHPEVMSAQKMHFVLRRDFSITGTANRYRSSELVYVSWSGKPIDDRNHIRWNDFIPHHGYIALVVYYDIAGVNSE